MTTALERAAWTTPESYAGFGPVGHYVIVSRHRDSDALSRSNWIVACDRLAQAAGLTGVPADDSAAPVYEWRASHWAVGWVEYLMVRPEAPEAVLQEARAILESLEDYPELDESHWSELEWEEAADYWVSMSVRDRALLIKDSHSSASLFAARRDYMPDDCGRVYEWLIAA